MKKVFSLVLALLIIVAAVPLGAFEFKAEAVATCPTLDSENAMAFIGFITNNGKLTEEQIKNSDAYKIMTGTYTGSDIEEKTKALKDLIVLKTNMLSGNAEANKAYYVQEAVKYLEKHVPASESIGLTEEIVNKYKNHYSQILVTATKDFIDFLFSDATACFQVSDLITLYSSVNGSIAKVEKIIDYTLAAANTFCFVYESEYAGRYGYFQLYVSSRKNYSSPTDEIFQEVLFWNQTLYSLDNYWASFFDMFSFITNKESFLNNFDTLDRWGEYTYQLEQYVASFYDDVVIDGEDGTTSNTVAVSSVKFAVSNFTMFYNYTLTNPTQVYPYNATNKSITYSSGDTSIATVDSLGKITPVSPGTVTIYAKAYGVTGSCQITILPFTATRASRQYTITGYCGNGGSVNIPSSVSDGTVVAIGEEAFYNCDSITGITIPDSVTNMGGYAFYDCNNLINVNLSQNITKINPCTFYNCNIVDITVPDNVTYIGDSAFNACSNLEKIKLSSNLNEISYMTFFGCVKLKEIIIPDGVATIGEYAFSHCSRLTSITIPNSVTTIGISAFEYCINLKYIDIPISVQTLGAGAFLGCSSLEKVYLQNNLISIGSSTFKDCDSLCDLDFLKGIQYIGSSAFEDCDGLTTINIPDSVIYLGNTSFQSCDNLSNVILPDSIEHIGDYAFRYCSNLTSLKMSAGIKSVGSAPFILTNITDFYINDLIEWCKMSFDNGFQHPMWIKKAKLYLNDELVTELVIPSGVLSIGDFAFKNITSITDVILPDTLTSIGSRAFLNCDNLSSIYIPERVTSIGEYAFVGCSSLKKIDVDEKNNVFSSIDGILFDKNQKNLIFYPKGISSTNYVIPDGIADICFNAFNQCDNVTTIVIPDSVQNIEEQSFYKCANLDTVIYKGTQEQWNTITIGSDNDSLLNANIIYHDNTAHDWQDIEVISEGDCTTDRVVIQKCSVCHQTQTVTTAASGHSNVFKFDSTKHWDECSVCGNKENETTHTMIDTETNSGTQSNCECGYSTFTANATNNDKNVGVNAQEGAFVTGTEISFNLIDNTQESFESVNKILSAISSKFLAYDITPNNPLNDGKTAEISFTIPENFGDSVAIYYVDVDSGIYEKLETIIKDGKAYATTNHFSIYVLVDETLDKVESDANFKFSGASLTINDNLAVDYKVKIENVADYSNLYVKFVFKGKEYTVKKYTANGTNYTFKFDDIAPNLMTEIIYATLYGTKDGVEYASEQTEYSVAQYCYNMLEKCSDDKYAEFRTLLVDLLNYGTQSQIYSNVNTSNLATASLTETQKAWGTQTEPELESVQNLTYETVENPTVAWKSGALMLNDAISMRFIIETASIENLSVKISAIGNTYTVNKFESIGNNRYYVYFNVLNASQMSEPVYLTVYNGDTAVSNTVRYSIESYAYAKSGGTDIKLSDLVIAMMKYGNAAYAYIN